MTFLKSQIAAFIGTVMDYLAMLYSVKLLGIHYTFAICIGGFVGAIINYTIGRYWAFNATEEKIKTQLIKYVLVSLGSITLKSGGTFFLTELSNLDYRITRLIIDIIVAICFNYTLQKLWVYKSPQTHKI